MGHWLARERTVQREDVVSRFDPRFWTVNFPRPMMAAVTTTAPDALRVDAVFYREDDLAGLIWDAEDRIDHPLLRYETRRDFRDCRLRFRWRSGGIRPLDAIHGPVLTIEGRDAEGSPRAWYVRLWNYARGAPEDAEVALDFADLAGGFLHPQEADPVWAGDVDRMFVSLVAPGYTAADAPLTAAAGGWAEMTGIRCDGPGSVLAIGDAVLPQHGIGIAGGYDDSYHMTPARLLRNALHLGYRGDIVHYVGMSHYFQLTVSGTVLARGSINAPCAAWHRDLARRAQALGFGIIWSLSYELLDRHCPDTWKQRDPDGGQALTGWDPPSTLLSPANPGAMTYLQRIATTFVAIAVEAGLAPKFQVGEPWWWVQPATQAPCLYDAWAVEAIAPAPIASVRGALSAAQRATLDRAGATLAASTAALCRAVKTTAPACVTHLLTYLPTVLDPLAPEAKRANMPVGWAAPAFDVLQLEDYDWAAAGDAGSTARGVAAAEARLGYPPGRQHYLSGFVLRPEDRGQWAAIDRAAETARARGVAATVLWALPQVLRDGFVRWDDEIGEESEVQAFDDVEFPLALGREVEVSPAFSTQIVTAGGGAEQRNVAWAEARASYDVGPGLRSEADIRQLLAFFRARLGPARGFRLRDPFDWEAKGAAIGTGDGTARRFALVRRYDAAVRRITRPVAGSVRVFVNGQARPFTLAPGGWVTLDAAPAAGAAVTADFAFDVPVRFAEDRLSVSRATFQAGSATSVPLIELRESFP